MKWSQYFIPTLKEVPAGAESVSHQFLLRAGLVHMLTSGVYSYLPLGWRVLKKIGLKPEQTVFIDDMKSFIRGARKVGIHTIRFKNRAQLIKDLRKLGIRGA